MAHELPKLDYKFDSFEPVIDAKTMEIHHGKHHQGYVTKLNAALEGSKYTDTPLDELLQNLKDLPQNIQTAVRNNGGGHANHSLFWKILSPVSEDAPKQPSGDLEKAIEKDLGGYAQFVEQFEKAALGQFGSGWAWLTVSNGKLSVENSPNQDSPLMEKRTPILGLDVWEHAYYLNYQNRRPDYVKAFFDVIRWEEVAKRFEQAA